MENRKSAGRKKVATKTATSTSVKNKRVDKKSRGFFNSLTQERKDFPIEKGIFGIVGLIIACAIMADYLYKSKQKQRSAVKTKKAVVAPGKSRKVATKKANPKVKK